MSFLRLMFHVAPEAAYWPAGFSCCICRSSPWKLVLRHVASCYLELWRRTGRSRDLKSCECIYNYLLLYVTMYIHIDLNIYVRWQMDDIRCIHESAGGSGKKGSGAIWVLPKGWWPFLVPIVFWRTHVWQLRITACDSQRQVESSYRFSRQLGQARCGDGIALLWIFLASAAQRQRCICYLHVSHFLEKIALGNGNVY